MPTPLPTNFTVLTASGSQWSAVVTITNSDGTLANITGKVFEFVVRTSTAQINGPDGAAVFSVNSTSSTANGTITVNTVLSQVQIIVNAVAVNLLTQGGGLYTLWMDPNLSDATALLTGQFLIQTVAAP